MTYRRRERILIPIIIGLILFFGFVEGWFFQQESDISLSDNVLLFALINLNLILLLLLIYLLLRNVVKLIFDRRRNILGSKLRTRLVVAFVGLTLIPTVPLFWVAAKFMSSSLDYWFNHKVEQSLEQSVSLAKDYLAVEESSLRLQLDSIKVELARLFTENGSLAAVGREGVMELLERFRIDAIFVLSKDGGLLWKGQKPDLPTFPIRKVREQSIIKEGEGLNLPLISLEKKMDALVSSTEISSGPAAVNPAEGRLVVARILPAHISEKLSSISSGYETYLQLKLLHNPFKTSHFITFSIVALLVIFAAIWFGFYLAKNITVPIQALVAATKRIAEGDLTVALEPGRSDEIGMLMSSFNKMVCDLRDSREQLAGAYDALQQSHLELEDSRRYMEVVLRNIAAGVVSVDAFGRIMTMNKSAEAFFGWKAEEAKGKFYTEFLQPMQMDIVEGLIGKYRLTKLQYIEQQVQIHLGDRPKILLIKASLLRDEQGAFLGVVAVLDDLTELEKAQRMAAWREVARRIAHEIKNPLTPIHLSAQRLRRRYAEMLNPERGILDECTRTIIQQVDHMKRLVNEFSKFARLPRAQLATCDLAAIIEESLLLYKHDHTLVTFELEKKTELPPLRLDRDQFRQVMINLIDNALYAINGEKGSIRISLSFDTVLKIARLECADTGHGLSSEDKLRIFEPYYSTKERGSGLGLAIVSSIIADHNGFIRVVDNFPKGTIIVIELPSYGSERFEV